MPVPFPCPRRLRSSTLHFPDGAGRAACWERVVSAACRRRGPSKRARSLLYFLFFSFVKSCVTWTEVPTAHGGGGLVIAGRLSPWGLHPARCSPLGPPAVPPWGLSGRSLSHPEAQIARTRLPFPASRRGRRFPVFPGPGAGGPSCCSEVFGGGQCLGGVWGRTVQTLPRVPCWFPGPRRSRSAHEVKGREIQLCPDSRTYIFLVSFV